MAGQFRLMAAVGLVAAVCAGTRGHAQSTPPASQRGNGATPSQQGTTPASPEAPPAAQQPPPDQPVFRAGINFVRVDVIVSDKNGNPVADLKPEDFEVVEQGQRQKIETFKLISLDGGLIAGPDGPPRQIRTDADEEAEASRDDVRLFAIFLDDYHVRRDTGMVARTQIARFVETQLGPTDMVGLMYPLQPVNSVRMTRNHAAVQKAILQFDGRKYDYTPRNQYEEQYAYYPTETVEQIRNQVSMGALKSLIVHMGGLKEGRKTLILVSEGYNAMLPPQMRDRNAQFPGFDNPNFNNPSAGAGSALEQRAQLMSTLDMETQLRDIWDLANKHNTAIYAVDPRGLATGEFGIDQNINGQTDRQYLNASIETLRTLAINTDGRTIINRNDLTIGMKQIVRDASAYYLLGYNSSFTETDGRFHEIKVRVKRPGVVVRSRKGYFAFTNDDAQRALAPPKPDPPKPVSAALSTIAQPIRSSRVIRSWIGTERAADGRTRVTFVWEPMPKAEGAQARNDDAPAQVSITAIARDGSPVFRGRIPSASGPGGAAAPASVSFDAVPGIVQLRVAVENGTADVLDSEVREFAVPDLTAPRIVLSTPAVFRSRTLRDFQQLKTDQKAMPTATREFTRAERLFVRVHAYGPGAPTVKARLLNRTGQSITDLAPSAAGANGVADIDVSLAALPPGEYIVEITGEAAGESAQELVGFRIAG